MTVSVFSKYKMKWSAKLCLFDGKNARRNSENMLEDSAEGNEEGRNDDDNDVDDSDVGVEQVD